MVQVRYRTDLQTSWRPFFRGQFRIGNRLEQAATLGILAKLAERRDDMDSAENYQQQAREIFRMLKRPDLIRQLKLDCSEL
jgi:hypothetical protein